MQIVSTGLHPVRHTLRKTGQHAGVRINQATSDHRNTHTHAESELVFQAHRVGRQGDISVTVEPAVHAVEVVFILSSEMCCLVSFFFLLFLQLIFRPRATAP